ncbi:MAG TPA: hypothetical protein VFZ40_13955 [Pyrinomonadaceae bacterium]
MTMICCQQAYGQPTKTPAQPPEGGNALLRERAFDLLETLADQIGTLQSAENRARLGSNIAAALWSHDENRARRLFGSVQSDINSGLQNPADDEVTETKTRMVFLQLRVDIVERIAKHDAVLAVDFFKATEPPSDKPTTNEFAEMHRRLELRLAQQVAQESPELTLKIARRILARGFIYELQPLLRLLNKKHKEQAVTLYKEIVAKLRDSNLLEDSMAFSFALGLAKSFKPPASDGSTYRELINLFIASALANGCGNKASVEDEKGWFCSQLAAFLPEMQSVDPSGAARLKQWAPEDNSESQWSDERYAELEAELDDLSEGATVDQILELVPKYPQMTQPIYLKALGRAMIQGDIERARKIVTDYEPDPEDRQYLLLQIGAAEKRASLDEDTMAEIQRMISEAPSTQERVRRLMGFARQIGTKDRKAALKLLNEAREIVGAMKPGKEQTEMQVDLATLYCLEQSDQGLEMMASLMPRFNDLVAAAVKLNSYENHYLRDGEWNMSSEGAVGSLLTGLAQNAAHFAWCDFDRAVNLAAQFERPEIRLMAQLKLAQGVLTGPPKRSPYFGQPFPY